MSFNLASCAHYTLMDFSPIVDLSRSLKTNIFVKFAPLWNVMRSCYFSYIYPYIYITFSKSLSWIWLGCDRNVKKEYDKNDILLLSCFLVSSVWLLCF